MPRDTKRAPFQWVSEVAYKNVHRIVSRGYDTTEFPLDSDDYHDLFEDCFLEAFTSYASLSAFQSLGINFNNDVVVEREEIKQGGPGWRQKSSYQITFRVMSLQPRTGL